MPSRKGRHLDDAHPQHSFASPQDGDEEPVGAVPRRREEQRLLAAVGRSRRLAADARRPRLRHGNVAKSEWFARNAGDLVAVLLGQHRAGGIDEPAAGLDQRRRRARGWRAARPGAGRGWRASAATWRRAAAARRRCRCRGRRRTRGRIGGPAPSSAAASPACSTWTLRAPARFSRSKIGRRRAASSS